MLRALRAGFSVPAVSLPFVVLMLLGGCRSGTSSGPSAGATLTSAAQPSAASTASPGDASSRPNGSRPASELPDEVAKPNAEEVRRLALATNAFGFELFARLGGTANAALSPASLSLALGMTYFGARGETAAEMKKVLHLDGDDAALGRAYASWIRSWLSKVRSGVELETANRLFVEATLTVEPAYLEFTRARFAASPQQLPLSSDSEVARAFINAWVEGVTHRKIVGLLPVGSVTADTRLALVNALYFKARWMDAFREAATRDADFSSFGGEPMKVPTMHASGSYRYADVDLAQVLELPYEGGEFAMGFVLPKKTNGLAEVERLLDAKTLDAWTTKLAVADVVVALPRFKVAPVKSLELKPALVALGMPIAFDPERVDLTGISFHARPEERLVIAEVFHKTYVAVDEHGTEAAAATAVVIVKGGASPTSGAPPKTFIADHPFLFYVRDTATGVLLFFGRVSDPRH